VLEIGTGSGYQTAILAEIAYKVYTIERIRKLFIATRKLLDQLQYHNIVAKCSDGTLGWPDAAPFDAIIVTAGSPDVPQALVDQLRENGRLVIPVGGGDTQRLLKIIKASDGIREKNLGACRFVRLIGNQGWKEE
jgi:protein-L-isoaspartate(D-aspartate) O-methyltransferase